MKLPWEKQRTELEREIAFHIETLADGYEADGMSRKEALLRARREFGGLEQCKEDCREESRWRYVVEILQDLRFGGRMMRKSPAVTVAAIVSLALGIGATTAMYSFAEAVLWRKIAVPAPEQIVELYWESMGPLEGLMNSNSGSSFTEGGMRVADFFSHPAFEIIRERSAGKVEVASHIFAQPVSVSFGGQVLVAELRGVSGNFFSLLRLQPFAGRLLGGKGSEVVVTHRFWERRLGRSEKAVGETMLINNHPYVITGILPREFLGLIPGEDVGLYTTIAESPQLIAKDSWFRAKAQDPFTWWVQLIGRRSADVSLAEVQVTINTAFASSWPAKPKSAEQTPRIRLVDASAGLGEVRRAFGSPARILLGLVLLVLVVACANIANLLLARAAERGKEVALRVSLGCGANRLMRQFFTESLLLAALGGALSIGVALSIGYLMGELLGVQLSNELSAGSLAATAAVTLVTVVLFGLYPAWRASRIDVAPVLKEGSGSAGTASRARLGPARMLVVAQVALGVLLVMAAMVYTGILRDLVNRDTGFEREHALLFDVRPGELGYADVRLETFHRDIEERLAGIPGVVAVGLARTRPMRGGGFHDGIRLAAEKKPITTAVHHATSGFMSALGVPLVAGRGFTPAEVRAQSRVAVISEQLAQDLNLSSPLGARVVTDGKEWEVIGVARNATYSRMNRPMPVTYVPMQKGTRNVTVVLRTRVSPLAVLALAREAVRSVDRNMPLVDVYTMEQQIARTLQRERMFAWLCGSFGVLALVLCVVGVYGLMSHATARRTSEIGIRMALGASGNQVMRQVVSEGMRLALGGIVLGVPLAIYAATIAQQQRMIPSGPFPYWTLAAAIGALIVSALLAVFGPALRASSIDPMRALRRS